MILNAKEVAEKFDVFEKDALEGLIKAALDTPGKEERQGLVDAFVFRIQTARELRDRIRLPEIKA